MTHVNQQVNNRRLTWIILEFSFSSESRNG